MVDWIFSLLVKNPRQHTAVYQTAGDCVTNHTVPNIGPTILIVLGIHGTKFWSYHSILGTPCTHNMSCHSDFGNTMYIVLKTGHFIMFWAYLVGLLKIGRAIVIGNKWNPK